MRGLKNVNDNNNKSGNQRKTHPFEEELAFISRRPHIAIPQVLSSMTTSTTSASTSSASTSSTSASTSSADITPSTSTSSASASTSPRSMASEGKTTKRKATQSHDSTPRKIKTPVNQVLEVMKEFMSSSENRHDKEMENVLEMHKQKMELLSTFIDTLKNAAKND